MSDDGLVPAADPRAAKDPLLQEVAEIGWETMQFAGGLAWVGSVDDDQRRQLEDFLLSGISTLPLKLLSLQAKCTLDSSDTSQWPTSLLGLIVWLIKESRRLIIQVKEVPASEFGSSATRLRDLAGRVIQAGTNPVSACRSPRPAGFLESQSSENFRRATEWAQPQYLKQYVPKTSLAAGKKELLASVGVLADPVTVYSEEEITAEYRCGGRPDHSPLYVEFVEKVEEYNLLGPYLSKNYKGPRLKLGKKLVYRHEEIAALSDKKNRREFDENDRR
jgi:hypothetical protein